MAGLPALLRFLGIGQLYDSHTESTAVLSCDKLPLNIFYLQSLKCMRLSNLTILVIKTSGYIVQEINKNRLKYKTKIKQKQTKSIPKLYQILEAKGLVHLFQITIYIFLFLIRRMEIGKLTLLGKGSSSEIYRYGSQQKGVVLKVVPAICSKESKHLANEYHILSSLKHQNIIKTLKYREKITLNESTKNVLVLENATHGSLLDFYRKARPTMNQVRWIFAELVEALHYLHCNYIVHRDLKLENVLVSQNDSQIQIKIADFGFACSTKQTHLSNGYKGTKRGYMAPEIHKIPTSSTQNSKVFYDMYKTDIFSLGVILFTLVLGRLPFEFATSENPYYRCISQGRYQDFWKMHQQVVSKVENEEGSLESFKQIFLAMVQEQPSRRSSIQEVLECSWLTGKQQIIKSIKKLPESTTATN